MLLSMRRTEVVVVRSGLGNISEYSDWEEIRSGLEDGVNMGKWLCKLVGGTACEKVSKRRQTEDGGLFHDVSQNGAES